MFIIKKFRVFKEFFYFLLYIIIGIYFNINLLFVIFTVISSIIVLNLHHRAPSKRRVPKWIRKYIIGHLGPCLGFSNEIKAFDRNKIIIENLNINPDNEKKKLELEAKQLENFNWNLSFLMNRIQNTFKPAQIKSERLRIKIVHEIIKCQQNLLKTNKKSIHRRSLNVAFAKNEIKLAKIYKEWKILSFIIDRLCFFIYLVCFVASSFWFFHGALS